MVAFSATVTVPLAGGLSIAGVVFVPAPAAGVALTVADQSLSPSAFPARTCTS